MERGNEALSKAKIKELMDGAPADGNVEIRLKDPKRTGTITLRGYTGSNGAYRPYVDKHGNERVFKFARTVYLDMKNDDDRLTLQAVVNHPIYIDGPRPVLVVVNHESDADAFVALKDNEALAGKIIADLKGQELQDFARVLLITVKPGSSDKVIKRAIYEKAETEPGVILNEWNDDNRELKVILRKGLEQNLFVYRQGRYSFDGQLMGTTFDIAVDWLKTNEDLVPSMRKQLK
jgi:hypothetical protein